MPVVGRLWLRRHSVSRVTAYLAYHTLPVTGPHGGDRAWVGHPFTISGRSLRIKTVWPKLALPQRLINSGADPFEG